MNANVSFLAELSGVCRLEWRRLRSSPRILILALLYLICAALLVIALGAAARAFQATLQASINNPDAVEAATERMRMGALGWFFNREDSPEFLEALAKVPLIVYVGFRGALFFVPAWVALLGFDVISEELSTKSIRYLTLRAGRTPLVIGKFLALGAVLVVLLGVINAGLLVAARISSTGFSGALWWITLLKLWGVSSLFALGYLSLTLLCSAAVNSPPLALTLNAVTLAFFALVSFWGDRAALLRSTGVENAPDAAYEYLRWVSPSHYTPMLLDPDPSRIWPGVAGFLGFTFLFISAACLLLERRDI